jgi:hypothetical protein
LPRRVIFGIEVVLFSPVKDPEERLTRISEALELIRMHSPRRFARVKRDLKRIALVARGGEIYDPGFRTYTVDLSVLARRSTEEAALAIVHEATHARLWNCNILTTPRNEARIEALCVSEEIDFASRLPHGAVLIEHARAKLEKPWWGDSTRAERMEDQLASLRVPKWMVAIRRLAWTRRSNKGDQSQ